MSKLKWNNRKLSWSHISLSKCSICFIGSLLHSIYVTGPEVIYPWPLLASQMLYQLSYPGSYVNMSYICSYISLRNIQQETPQCDKTRFSTLQPSIDMTGIRNERWQWRKNDAIILVASVACTKFGVNRPKQTKVIEWKLNFFFSYSDLDLDHRHLGSNPKLRLDVSYPYSKFGVNKP